MPLQQYSQGMPMQYNLSSRRTSALEYRWMHAQQVWLDRLIPLREMTFLTVAEMKTQQGMGGEIDTPVYSCIADGTH